MSSPKESSRELVFVSALGRGGFGSVYLAWLHGQKGWKRKVAVKVMNSGVEAPDIRARQWDEARLLGLLAHENIVQIVDVTEIDGRPAALMEYVEGADLARIAKAELANGRALPVRATTQVGAAVCAALDAAWTATNPETGQPLRVIHRDLKPANLLVTPHGGVKVLDFGIARGDFAREAVTRSAAYGTPRYMAPEQWIGSDIGPGTDIYSLGVTLWELLSGQTWERPPLVVGRFDLTVAERCAAVPANIAPLLARMMAWSIDARPTATEVQTALEAVVATDEPLRQLAQRVLPRLIAEAERAGSDGPLPPRQGLPGLHEPLASAEPSPHEVTPAASRGSATMPMAAHTGGVAGRRLPEPLPGPEVPPATRPGRGARVAGYVVIAAAAVGITVLAGLALVLTMVAPRFLEAPPGDVAPAPSEAVTAAPTNPSDEAGSSAGDGAPGTTAPSAGEASAQDTPEPTVAAADPGSRRTPSPGVSSPARPVAPSKDAPPPVDPGVAPATVAPLPTEGTPPTPTTETASPAPGLSPPAPAQVPLTITSIPLGAEVSVDGVAHGTTPTTLQVAPGTHRIHLRGESGEFEGVANAGTKGRTTWSYDFTARAWRRVL